MLHTNKLQQVKSHSLSSHKSQSLSPCVKQPHQYQILGSLSNLKDTQPTIPSSNMILRPQLRGFEIWTITQTFKKSLPSNT